MSICGANLDSSPLGCGDDRFHLIEDVHAGVLGLVQGLLHDLGRDARDLDVHLDGGHAVAGARDLEVHVAQMVFIAQDVGQDQVFVAFLDQAHGDAGDGGLDGHACVHEGQGAAADRGHGRGAVGFHDVGDDTRW
jgi:hypothetical protein